MKSQTKIVEIPYVVEYMYAGKVVGRIKFPSEKMFNRSELVRVEFVKATYKFNWDGFLRLLYRSGITYVYDPPNQRVELTKI